jgi:hypothetical protein
MTNGLSFQVDVFFLFFYDDITPVAENLQGIFAPLRQCILALVAMFDFSHSRNIQPSLNFANRLRKYTGEKKRLVRIIASS